MKKVMIIVPAILFCSFSFSSFNDKTDSAENMHSDSLKSKIDEVEASLLEMEKNRNRIINGNKKRP